MTLVLTSLTNANADAVGDILEFNIPTRSYSLQFTVAGPSFGGAWTVFLEASLDGVNFFSAQHTTISGIGGFFLDANGPLATHIRARLVQGSGTGGPNVTAIVAFGED